MRGRVVPPPKIAQRTRLSDDVASYIRELIMAGRLVPGEVVNIDSFAREIGVSATPVREALMVLVSEGFLVAEKHRGFIVASLDKQDIKDVFDVHAMIGGELAARAARQISPECLARLEQLQADIESAFERGDLGAADAANQEFHETVVNQADSAKLAWLFNIGVRFVPTSVFYSEDRILPSKEHHSVVDHKAILAAMRQGDPEKAREAMSTHIAHSSELLLRHLEQAGLWDDVISDGQAQAVSS
jgi:DNA-binding GntR family transcriptional regulator